ncbi:hypothetical protein BDD12DRAFT_905612 [Trichophaea hybrida]|nr:hypothetical protein BDD12DRAFT_905612 [Trichophaea hybrida]
MCAKTSPSTAVLPSVPVRPQKDGAVPSWLRTDGKPPSRPVLSDVGRTGRLTTLRPAGHISMGWLEAGWTQSQLTGWRQAEHDLDRLAGGRLDTISPDWLEAGWTQSRWARRLQTISTGWLGARDEHQTNETKASSTKIERTNRKGEQCHAL